MLFIRNQKQAEENNEPVYCHDSNRRFTCVDVVLRRGGALA